MSEEKKASWEASAAQEPKPSAAAAPIAAIDEAAVVQAAVDGDSASGSENNMRARNQHVLPGILGKQLRTAYGELLNNPVPDTINELVKKLKEAEQKAAGKPREEEGQ